MHFLLKYDVRFAGIIQLLTLLHFVFFILILVFSAISASFIDNKLYSILTYRNTYSCEKKVLDLFSRDVYELWDKNGSVDPNRIESVNAAMVILKLEEQHKCSGFCSARSTYKFYVRHLHSLACSLTHN